MSRETPEKILNRLRLQKEEMELSLPHDQLVLLSTNRDEDDQISPSRPVGQSKRSGDVGELDPLEFIFSSKLFYWRQCQFGLFCFDTRSIVIWMETCACFSQPHFEDR